MENNKNTMLEEALLAVASDIFDEHFIITPSVREEVIRMMLRSGAFVELMSQKDDLLHFAIDGAALESRDPFAVSRPKIRLPMGLRPHERTAISAACPDVELQFMDGGFAPHGRAAAFRMIHWNQALSLVSHHLGTVLDVGGNYAKYAKSTDRRSYAVHSCTKRVIAPEPEGELEWHRHLQRDVDLQISGITDTNYCISGAENCTVGAKHGVCIHALYDIDPDLWTTIFKRHGLEYVVCYFHYDVSMEVEDVGYMPGPGMHWARTADNEIQCHFEGDSSHPYTHRRDWFLRYGSTWTLTEPDWDYVLYYEVEFIDRGNAKSSFTRLQKNTLGHSDSIAQFRYIDVDESVELMVPKFNPLLGKSVNDPRAYTVKTVRTSMGLFSHVLRFGVSNDTERSDLPLTFDAVKDQCHTFNHVRKVGGTSVTVPYRLGNEEISDVATGMYLVIVKRAAMNKVKYVAYTENMKKLQRRWGAESVVLMAGKAFAYATIAPFMLMAESLDDVATLLVASMRRQVVNDLVVMHAHDVVPYRLMRPVQTVAGTCSERLTGGVFTPPSDNEMFNRKVEPSQFYSVFKDTMDPEHRRKVEEYLQQTSDGSDVKKGDVVTPVPVSVGIAEEPAVEEEVVIDVGEVSDDVVDRGTWVAEHEKLQDELETMELPPRNVNKYSFAQRTNHDKVWSFARPALREYQLYNLDVALHVLAYNKDRCRQTWGSGRPRLDEVQQINIQMDLGIKYFAHNDTVIEGMDVDTKYAVVIDPIDLVHKVVYVKGGVCHVNGVKGMWVFVSEALRIFNMFTLASRARKMLEKPWTLKIKATLVDGVPGCGKTYAIIQAFTIRDVIITMVRETRDATYDELVRDPRFGEFADVLKKRCRTGDSGGAHGLPLARTLFADEGIMAHAGVLIAGVKLSAAKELVAYGDSAQISFIDRGSKIGNMHFASLFYWSQIIEQNESMRCPADAIWVSSQFYPEERRSRIKTCSPIMRSIRFVLETNPNSPYWADIKKPWVLASILRGDKDGLVTKHSDVFCQGTSAQPQDPRVPVFSVHEIQGRTKPLVRAVRMTPFNPDVVNSEPHLNVMFTRHTLRLDYGSCRDETTDRAAMYAKRAMELTDEQLRDMMIPTPKWLQDRMLAQQIKYAAQLG